MSSPSPSDTRLIVAFDIGKNVHWLGCYDDQLREVVAPHKLTSNLSGFAHATATIDSLLSSGRYQGAIIGHEHTGVYHEPWAWQLQAHYHTHMEPGAVCPVVYRWLNPLLTHKRQGQGSLRQRTNDKSAVRAIAACLVDGLGHPARLATDETAHLREVVRSYEQVSRQLRYLTRQLAPQVDRLWPGAIIDVSQFCQAHPELGRPRPIVETHPFDRDRLAVLLRYCPNPHEALALGPKGIIALFHEHGYRAGPKTAEIILAALRLSPLPPKAIASLYADRLRADYQFYCDVRARAENLVENIVALVSHTPARYVDSIPGVSPLLAAQYLGPVGSGAFFTKASQIWALAGFDVVTSESGDTKRLGHITKQGNPGLRDALYQIGFHTVRECPPIGTTYLNARARGMEDKAAIIHAAHKANRLCFTLLREERFYRPVTVEEEQRFRDRWQSFHQQTSRQKHHEIASQRIAG